MLNENIRNLRKSKGLSQEELAIRLNVVRQTISSLDKENMKSISEKLEVINLQLAKRSSMRIHTVRYLLISLCAIITIIFIAFAAMNGEYLTWDFNDPELAIVGTLLHGFEFLFIRLAPFLLTGSIIGIVFTYKKR